MWTLQGKRSEIWESIAAHPDETSVCVKTKPGRQLFLRLLEQTAVKEVFISPGLWKTVPAKVRAALDRVGIKVVVEGRQAGRPAEYGNKARELALGMMWEGRTAGEISSILGVPQTAFYWWKQKEGLAKKRRMKKRKADYRARP